TFNAFRDSTIVKGIVFGLLFGKPIGITLFCFIAIQLGLSKLPSHVNWRHMIATGFLGGIGFTMSLFVANLAFHNPEYLEISKGAILTASVLSGLTGFLMLSWTIKKSAS